jgi:hypothetical protein
MYLSVTGTQSVSMWWNVIRQLKLKERRKGREGKGREGKGRERRN